MATKTNTGNRGGSGAGSNGRGDGASVSQLREIIFGEQMEDYDARFARLEEKLKEDFAALKASLDSEVSDLKTLVKEQGATLADQSVERLKLADMLEGVAAKLRR